MITIEQIATEVESLGYKTQLDQDGNIHFVYQSKVIDVVLREYRDHSTCVRIFYPGLDSITDGNLVPCILTCNKVNRKIKLVKLFLDEKLKHVTAACESSSQNLEELRLFILEALRVFEFITTFYYNIKDQYRA